MKSNQSARTSLSTILAAIAAGFLAMAPGGCPFFSSFGGAEIDQVVQESEERQDREAGEKQQKEDKIAKLERERKDIGNTINDLENEIAILESDLAKNKEKQSDIKFKQGARVFIASQGEADVREVGRGARDAWTLSGVNAERAKMKEKQRILERDLRRAVSEHHGITRQIDKLQKDADKLGARPGVTRGAAKEAARRSSAQVGRRGATPHRTPVGGGGAPAKPHVHAHH